MASGLLASSPKRRTAVRSCALGTQIGAPVARVLVDVSGTVPRLLRQSSAVGVALNPSLAIRFGLRLTARSCEKKRGDCKREGGVPHAPILPTSQPVARLGRRRRVQATWRTSPERDHLSGRRRDQVLVQPLRVFRHLAHEPVPIPVGNGPVVVT